MDLGKMVDKAKEWAGKNPEKADSYVDKGTDFVNEKFAGHEDQVGTAGQKAKDYLHGQHQAPGEDQAPPPPPPGEAPPGQAPPPPPPGGEPPRP